MTRTTLLLALSLAVGLFAPLATAQPAAGDLVLTIATGPGGKPTGGFVAHLTPTGNGALTTLVTCPTNSFPNWVCMAPNNQDLVTSRISLAGTTATSRLMLVSPAGQVTTMTPGLSQSIDGYELDHDNRWIAVLNDFGSRTHLIGVDHATGSVTTFVTQSSATEGFNEVTIDRDPGAAPYALAWATLSTASGPKVFGADRQGNLTTIATTSGNTLTYMTGIELHPRSGDYLTTGGNGSVASRVTKQGKVTSLNTGSLPQANCARIRQDDTAWMMQGTPALTSSPLVRYDFATNTVLASRQVSHPSGYCTSIESYGSRTLTCNGSGQPGTSVTVSLQSQKAAAASASYAIAASLARRPGTRLPNGQWLDLAPDALFFMTASNLAPGTFQNFQGTLSALGGATARVNIPAAFPPNLGVSVFVAGVIYNAGGIVEVTPSHWIVL